MLGLPKATEVNRQLPKNAIYAKFKMTTAAKDRIDRDISRIYIVNEVTAEKLNLKDGAEVRSFFVMSVLLKRKDFDEKNILTLSRLIPQNMVLVPEYEGRGKIVICRNGKLLQTDWQPTEQLSLEIKGLDLDAVWENMIKSLEGGEWHEELSLDENLVLHEKQAKLQKEITRLEKLARAEKQPKKKFEIAQQIKELQCRLNGGDINGQAKNADHK